MAINGKPGLTPRQHRAINALITAPDKKAAAELANVGYRSIIRWLEDPIFITALNQAEGSLLGDAVRSLVSDMQKNQETIRSIRDDQLNPANVRLRAAAILDDSLLRWRDLTNFENRIQALEVLYERNHG